MNARTIFTRGGQIHRRSQDLLWGALFPQKKLTTFFSRRPQNTGQNYQMNQPLPDPPKIVKIMHK